MTRKAATPCHNADSSRRLADMLCQTIQHRLRTQRFARPLATVTYEPGKCLGRFIVTDPNVGTAAIAEPAAGPDSFKDVVIYVVDQAESILDHLERIKR